jgi:4-methylaminobutanoate oxidase (formaldehyde-forming)
MGPTSRELLSSLTDADLSKEAFPFSTAQQIDVGFARAWALRMTYVGELGWELYLPTMFTLPVFDKLMEVGEKVGLKLVGMQAVNSLRLETGYRHWESDITPDDTPYEAGLGFSVKLDKGDFIGREALIKLKEAGLTRKMVMFTLDDPKPLLFGDEPIYRDGTHVGELSSGAYGFKIGSAVGMGYVKNPEGVNNDWIKAGNYQLEVEGELHAATFHLRSPYDPKNERTKM